MASPAKQHALFDTAILRRAVVDSFVKLDPRCQIRNPVMFTVYVGSILTTGLFVLSLQFGGEEPPWFIFAISAWLVVHGVVRQLRRSNGRRAREGPGRCVAQPRHQVPAKKFATPPAGPLLEPVFNKMLQHGELVVVPASDLRRGHVVFVEAGDYIPADGEITEGVASVDESAITGESAPVIRESGGDRSSVTGGTRVLVRLARGASDGRSRRNVFGSHDCHGRRGKTPKNAERNRLEYSFGGHDAHFSVGLRDAFAVFAVQRRGCRSRHARSPSPYSSPCWFASFPRPSADLLSAIGIAGMDRMIQANVIAMSGRAVEAAGDVDVLLLDKTGTITLGNRQAVEFHACRGRIVSELADAAQLASLADETPEGRSIVVLAKTKYGLRGRNVHELHATFIPFSAQTRYSGVNLDGRQIRKGAAEAIEAYVIQHHGKFPADVAAQVERISKQGGTPLVVAEGGRALGVIHLKDIVKGGMKERFVQMRQMGIQTVMITGDNPLTAAAIAAEAGVDDFLAEATPEAKLSLIRKYQAAGHLVAMTGDGTNDSPALAQADVAVAMNTGTQAAKEAGNMVDLDSNPTKLIEIVEIGKQLLMTRGALTTFSLANDVSKYFAIIPAAFLGTYPALGRLNIMHLATPASAILSAVIFNALIIVALDSAGLEGVRYRPIGAAALLRRNLLVFGLGGLLVPFVGIKLIDMLLVALHCVVV